MGGGGQGKGPQLDPPVLQRPGLKVSAGRSKGRLKTLKIGSKGDIFARQSRSLRPVTAACAFIVLRLPRSLRACVHIYIHTRIYARPCACIFYFCVYIYIYPCGAWQVKEALNICFGKRRLEISAPSLHAAVPLTKQ